MRRISTSFFALILVFLASSAIAQSNRVGTFDRQSIVVAYYRSPLWAATLKEKQAALDQAQRANDQARIQELNAWGRQSQELAHEQLAGEAPISNIMDALQPAFREIEKSSNVADVVPCPCPSIKASTLDVTPQLLDWLKADANTRKIIEGLPHK